MYTVKRPETLPNGGVPVLPDREDEIYLRSLAAAARKPDEATALEQAEATAGATFDAANAPLAAYANKIEPELEMHRCYKTARLEALRTEQEATDQDILTQTPDRAARRNKIRRFQAPWALVIFLPLLAAVELSVFGSVIHESRLLGYDNTIFGKVMATLTVVSPFLLGFLKIGQYKTLTRDAEKAALLKRYQWRAAFWGIMTLLFAAFIFAPTHFAQSNFDLEGYELINSPGIYELKTMVPYLGILLLGSMIMANTTIAAALFLQEQRDSERAAVCHVRANEVFEFRETALDQRMSELQGLTSELAHLQATNEALVHARSAFVATARAEVADMRARALHNVVPLRTVSTAPAAIAAE